jgi:O-antigen/teichoic acid export membrane protein
MLRSKYAVHKETINNVIWRTIQIIGKQGTALLIFFMSAIFLSPFDFGLLNYLIAVLSLLVVFCDFGISSATSKYTTEYKVKASKKLNSILFSVSLVVVIIALVISLIIVFFGRSVFDENYLYILYFLPFLFLVPLSSVADGYYRGLKEFKKLSIITVIVGPISLIVSYFLIKEYLLIGAIISQNLLFLLLTVSLFVLRKDFKLNFNKKVLRTIIGYSVIIGLGEIGYFLYSTIDVLILEQFGYVLEIGYYQIANKIFSVIIIPFAIMGQVIAPNITKLVSKKRYDLVRKKYVKHLYFFLAVGVLLSIVLYLVYPTLLDLFLSKYFIEESVTIFNWLLIMLPMYIIARFLSQGYLVSSGNAKYNLLMIPFGILNIVLNYIFIAHYGFIGVVYSTIICMTLNRLAIFTLLYFKFK